MFTQEGPSRGSAPAWSQSHPHGRAGVSVSEGTHGDLAQSVGRADMALSPQHTPGEAGPQPKLRWGRCRQALCL